MDFTQLPAPDELFISLLALAGVSTGILAMLTLGFTLLAWYQSGKSVVDGAAKAKTAAGRAWRTLGEMKPVQVGSAISGTIFIMGAQILTLWLCYISANIIWLSFFDHDLFNRFANLIDTNPMQFFAPGIAGSFLVSNWFTTLCVTIGAVVIIWSYVQAVRGKHFSTAGATFIVAMPAALLLGIACLVLLLAGAAFLFVGGIYLLGLLAGADSGNAKSFQELLFGATIWGTIGIASGLYCATCRFALAGAQRIVKTFGLTKRIVRHVVGRTEG
jgi:hypothetical protein